jgi:hypothetical protein
MIDSDSENEDQQVDEAQAESSSVTTRSFQEQVSTSEEQQDFFTSHPKNKKARTTIASRRSRIKKY